MSYRSNMKVYGAGSQATAMADISKYLQAVGWTLEKAISGTSHVLSSVGESGTEPKGWLHLYVSGNDIYFKVYAFFDTATDTGYGGAYGNTSSLAYFAANAAATMYFYGSKDLAIVRWGNSTLMGVGHWPKRGVTKPKAVLAKAEAAGASVVVEVDNTDRFYINDYYTIYDPSTGCRERVQVTAVSAGASLTIATLANNYAAGSIVGRAPSTFAQLTSYGVCPVVHPSASGTADGGDAAQMYATRLSSYTCPDGYVNLYATVPLLLCDNGTYNTPFTAYSDENIVSCGEATQDNLYGVMDDANQYVLGTASAGGESNLDVSGTPFTDDAFIGKVLVLTGGAGAGQTRYITDNTTSRILVGQAFVTNPNATTTFAICDRVYRNLGLILGGSYAPAVCLEKIGEP